MIYIVSYNIDLYCVIQYKGCCILSRGWAVLLMTELHKELDSRSGKQITVTCISKANHRNLLAIDLGWGIDKIMLLCVV